MPGQGSPAFGGLLRQLREQAQLSQEELAEAATVSARTVSDLERGISHTARKATAELLADALGLADFERACFVAAARGKAVPPNAGTGARRSGLTAAGAGYARSGQCASGP